MNNNIFKQSWILMKNNLIGIVEPLMFWLLVMMLVLAPLSTKSSVDIGFIIAASLGFLCFTAFLSGWYACVKSAVALKNKVYNDVTERNKDQIDFTVKGGASSINEPVILYRGDREVEIRFTLKEEAPFMFNKETGSNIIEVSESAYGQLVIKTPNDLPAIFSEVAPTSEGKIVFKITGEMIDEITEVGNYSFQIRLFNEGMNSRVTLPEVNGGIEIREPIASEDTASTVVITYDATAKRLIINDNFVSYDENTKTLNIEGLIL